MVGTVPGHGLASTPVANGVANYVHLAEGLQSVGHIAQVYGHEVEACGRRGDIAAATIKNLAVAVVLPVAAPVVAGVGLELKLAVKIEGAVVFAVEVGTPHGIGMVAPAGVVAHLIDVLGVVDGCYLIGVRHHVELHTDVLGTGGHLERTVVREVGTTVELTLSAVVAVTALGTEHLRPVVVGNAVAGLVVADGKPGVLCGVGHGEGDGEDRIIVHVGLAVRELQCAVDGRAGPVVGTTDEVVSLCNVRSDSGDGIDNLTGIDKHCLAILHSVDIYLCVKLASHRVLAIHTLDE